MITPEMLKIAEAHVNIDRVIKILENDTELLALIDETKLQRLLKILNKRVVKKQGLLKLFK